MKKENFLSFELSFLVVGLPILFILREYIPISKNIFTYSIMGFILLTLINYKNLVRLKLYSKIPIYINVLLITLYTIFLLNLMYSPSNSSSIYVFITILIYFALLTREEKDFSIFYKYILIISSVVTVLTLLTTPLDLNYWAYDGGRLYVGDTHNPNLSAFTALINILVIVFYLLQKDIKLKLYIKISFLVVSLGSLYIYFLSFSKSAIVGLVFSLIYLFPRRLLKNKKFLINIVILVVSVFLILIFLPAIGEEISNKFMVLNSAYDAYFYGKTSNLAADSAAIRHQTLSNVLPILKDINLFTGNSIFTTRADFPLLQVFTDLGFFAGFINLFLMLIFPLILIIKQDMRNKILSNDLEKSKYFAVLLYLFNLPNLFLHGTPYEYSMWLPILILYKFLSWKKEEPYV